MRPRSASSESQFGASAAASVASAETISEVDHHRLAPEPLGGEAGEEQRRGHHHRRDRNREARAGRRQMKFAREFRQQRLHAIEQLEDGEAADQEGRDDPGETGAAATQLGARRCDHRQVGNHSRAVKAAGPTPIPATRIGRKKTNIASAAANVAQTKASRHGGFRLCATSASAGPRQMIEG